MTMSADKQNVAVQCLSHKSLQLSAPPTHAPTTTTTTVFVADSVARVSGTMKLQSTLVHSCLNYCNVLLAGHRVPTVCPICLGWCLTSGHMSGMTP